MLIVAYVLVAEYAVCGLWLGLKSLGERIADRLEGRAA